MDVISPPPVTPLTDVDPKQQLADDVERARAEREDLERQILADREKLGSIRTGLDSMIGSMWRDVFGQQQAMREKENISAAFTFAWVEGYQWVSIIAFIAAAAAAVVFLQATGAIIAVGLYALLALIGYFVAREQCLAPIRKARSSYLGEDGKDIRFVAFTHYEPGLNHPLIGFDGPTNGMIEDRAWKIPGVRDKDALEETFVEVIDERRSNVLLTRFPDRKPTLVHADLENPFIRAYGVFFQRALERHLRSVVTQADDFRQIVQHFGARKVLDDRIKRLDTELNEFDGTAAIMRGLPLPAVIRNKLLRQVSLFRLDEPATARGLFLITGDRVDATDVVQTVARASAASLLRLTFSQIKIGYVGQGASTVSRLFDTAKRAKSILFIDEAERFFGTGGSQQYESMRREAVQAILKEWEALEDRTDVWVVAAAKSREGLDEGIVARFGTLIDFFPEDGTQTTTVIAGAEEVTPESIDEVVFAEPVLERLRLLSAMFAHVDQMEAQGVTVPRAVLISGSSNSAKQAVVKNLATQTSLPVIDTLVDDLDGALMEARDRGRALLAVEVPEYADPGAVAHLAVIIDELNANKVPVFVLTIAAAPDAIDPELRSRVAEVIDLSELDGEARRSKLRELLEGKATDFDIEALLGQLEAQTDGMTEEHLRTFVDEAFRKAALRAIEAGNPEQIVLTAADLERRVHHGAPATKDDEAAL